MKIDVTGAGLGAAPELRAHAERRVLFALSRFADRVREVRVRLCDVNGPRGGIDKRCTIGVRGRGFAPLFVEAFDADAFAAFDRAAGLARRVVVRALERSRPAVRLAPGRSELRTWRG